MRCACAVVFCVWAGGDLICCIDVSCVCIVGGVRCAWAGSDVVCSAVFGIWVSAGGALCSGDVSASS